MIRETLNFREAGYGVGEINSDPKLNGRLILRSGKMLFDMDE